MKSNIYRILIFTITLVITLSFVSCGVSKNTTLEENFLGEESINMENLKESVIKKYDMAPEELDNIDFADFLDTYDLNEDNIDEYYIPDLIEMYKEKDTNRADYTYIYDKAEGKLAEDDVNNISVMVWEYHEGNTNKYMVIDLNKNEIYYSMKDIFASCGQDNKIASIDADDEIFIKETIKNSGISEWKNGYIGTNGDTTGNFSWSIGIEVENGTCYKYRGYGVLDSNTPDALEPMFNALVKRFE